MNTYNLKSLNELPEAAKWLANNINEHSVVAFYGEMGAGKTTLIKELCKQLNVKDIVSSPTFALVNEYKTFNEESIFHFDFYRINRIEEAYDLGYEDYFFSGNLCLIEWPEKIEELLPEQTLKLDIKVNTDQSRLLAAQHI